MSRFRLWLHERVIPRLDNDRDRRAIAWMLVAVFAIVASGPLVSRAQTAIFAPKIALAPTWTSGVTSGPVTFRATVDGDGLQSLAFQVYAQGSAGAPLMEVPGSISPTERNVWLYKGFNGQPGARYDVKAVGAWGPNGTPVVSTNALAFSIADVADAPGAPAAAADVSSAAPSIEQLSPIIDAASGRVTLRARTTGEVDNVHFRIVAPNGLGKLFPAATIIEGSDWAASAIGLLPPDTYAVSAIGKTASGSITTNALSVEVPKPPPKS